MGSKSGYLPDISSRFAFWTEYATNHLDKKKWKDAEAGLYNINSCLDEEYLVSVSTTDYNEKIKSLTTWTCYHCKTKTEATKIKTFELSVPLLESILIDEKKQNVWICPKCKKTCKQNKTEIIKEETVQPFYYKVVPSPPRKTIGLHTRVHYEAEFKKWFYNFLEELQHQLALYRIEYIGQHGHDMGELGYKQESD